MRRILAVAVCFFSAAAAFASWTQMPGSLAQVSVGSATQMWGVQANQQIWRWNGSGWTQIPGYLVCVSVGSDATVWGVNANQQIYRRDGDDWTLIPGTLVQISVGSATNVWGVNASDRVYRWNGSDWDQVADGLMYVSAAADGSVWGVKRTGQVWRRDGSGWTQTGWTLANIAVGSASNVWGVTANGEVQQRTGISWTTMPGPMKQVAVGVDGTVLGVNSATQLFRWTPDAPAASAPAPASASPSANGSNVMTTMQILRSATNDFLVSANQSFRLVMQSDGNLCEYRGAPVTDLTAYKQQTQTPIWCSNTTGTGGKFSVQMHATNNFCVTTGDEWGQGPALWCTNKVGSGSGPAYAMLGDDGNFFVRQGTPSAPGPLLWETGMMSLVSVTPPAAGASIEWSAGQDGFVCPPVCSKPVLTGRAAYLRAIPPPGQQLTGWTGSACTPIVATNSCSFTVAAGGTQQFGAEFKPAFALTASPSPNVIIRGNYDKLYCPQVCTSSVLGGSAVQVLAFSTMGETFVRWNGDCAGQGNPCALTMNGPKSVSAFYVPKFLPVDLTITGAPGGQVISDSPMFFTSRSMTLDVDTAPLVVHLKAEPEFQYRMETRFKAWEGDCAGQANPCTLDMSSSHKVTANFEPVPKRLILVTSVRPSGGGAVSEPLQIMCGDVNGTSYTRCFGQFADMLDVTLRASPSNGYTKIKWGGDCAFAGDSQYCTLRANRDYSVMVEFSP